MRARIVEERRRTDARRLRDWDDHGEARVEAGALVFEGRRQRFRLEPIDHVEVVGMAFPWGRLPLLALYATALVAAALVLALGLPPWPGVPGSTVATAAAGMLVAAAVGLFIVRVTYPHVRHLVQVGGIDGDDHRLVNVAPYTAMERQGLLLQLERERR